METDILFETKDGEYSFEVKKTWKNELMFVKTNKTGTELDMKEVSQLISVMSNWLSNALANESIWKKDE